MTNATGPGVSSLRCRSPSCSSWCCSPAAVAQLPVRPRATAGSGWGPADPTTEPAEVLPPVGLKLPGRRRRSAWWPSRGARRPPTPPGCRPPCARCCARRCSAGTSPCSSPTCAPAAAVSRAAPPPITPASTTKLLTTTAALEALGPMARFRTTVRWVPRTRSWCSSAAATRSWPARRAGPAPVPAPRRPGHARPADRARVEGPAGHPEGRAVRLAYDDSYFTGPAVNPAWPDTYVPEDVVPPISALWVDEARVGPSATSTTRRQQAADVFRCRARGQRPEGASRASRGPRRDRADDLAAVSSAPLGEIVEHTLAVSDNKAAEVLARHVGLAERQEGVVRRPAPPPCSRCCAGSAYPPPATAVRRQRALAPEPALPGDPGRTSCGSPQHGRPPGAARGDHRPAGGRVHRVADLPLRRGSRRRQGPGAGQDRHPDRRARAGRRRRRPSTAPGWASSSSPTRSRPEKQLEAQTLIDRIAGALGACRCGVGSAP